jgi:predicted PurR-regulated permease PerM
MNSRSPISLVRTLQIGAYIFILVWGIKAASSVLGPLILGLMLAYAVLPFPTWLMLRFKLSKRRAATLTAIVLIASSLLALFAMVTGVARFTARLPIYEQHLNGLYQQLAVFATRFPSFNFSDFTLEQLLTAERLGNIAMSVIPQGTALISTALLICLLATLIVMEMLPAEGSSPGAITRALQSQAFYARSYVVVTAKSAGINALINFVFLLLMGVDNAFLWCFLYFFLAFIPFLGSGVAMVPPILLALLMLGWKSALLVAVVLIITQIVVGNILMPILAKKSMSISFLEFTLSLVGWSFLLGIPGAIAAIPLTLVLKELISKDMKQNEVT